jgi:hypothetical protein
MQRARDAPDGAEAVALVEFDRARVLRIHRQLDLLDLASRRGRAAQSISAPARPVPRARRAHTSRRSRRYVRASAASGARTRPCRSALPSMKPPKDAALASARAILLRHRRFLIEIGGEVLGCRRRASRRIARNSLVVRRVRRRDAHAPPPKRMRHCAICSSVILANRTSGGRSPAVFEIESRNSPSARRARG